MNRHSKSQTKSIWFAIFWTIILSLAFFSATCSKKSAAQPTEQIFTCYAESVSAIAAGMSPDRTEAMREAIERCQSLSPENQTCRITRCLPR